MGSDATVPERAAAGQEKGGRGSVFLRGEQLREVSAAGGREGVAERVVREV